MQNNTEDLNQDQNLKQTGDNLSGELFENLDRDEIQKRNKIKSLKQSLQYLFGGDSFLNYHEFTKKEMESGHGAGLYTIIKDKGKNEKMKNKLIKIGSGEFNIDIFNVGGSDKESISKLKGLHNRPLALIILNQEDNFRIDNEELDNDKEIKDYLDEHAIIIVPEKKQAYINNKKKVNSDHINIRHLDDAISTSRLAILHKEFPNGQFQTGQNSCIDTIQKFQEMEFDKFYNTTKKHTQYMNQEMIKLIGCFRHMGITQDGKNEEKTYRELYNLIQSFKIQEQKF